MKAIFVDSLPSNAIKATYTASNNITYQYFATVDGQIYTLHRSGRYVVKAAVKQCQTKRGKKYQYGHTYISLYAEGTGTTVTVSKLIALALLPNPNNYPLALHLDETLNSHGLLDNSSSNLYWGTYQDNANDRRNKK